MKRFIPTAFATLAFPFLAMAQTSTPTPDEEKPLDRKKPVPARDTTVPGQSEKPAKPEGDRPGGKRRGPPGAKERPGAPKDKDTDTAPTGATPETKPSTSPERPAPTPGKETPSARPGETPGTPPSTRGKGPANRGRPSETPGTPSPSSTPDTPKATPDTPPQTPGTPPSSRGKGPGNRGKGQGPATPGTPPSSTPDTPPTTPDKPKATPATPTETPATPPSTRGNGPGNRGKGPGNRGRPSDTPGTPPTTPGTPSTTPGTPSTTPGTPSTTPGTPSTTPGTTDTRPMPGRRSTDPQGRGGDPSRTPATAPTPGAPMPGGTNTPRGPGDPNSAQRPEGRERPQRPERPAAEKPPTQETAKVLQDEPKRDRQADAAQARKIDNKEDAKRLLLNILGGSTVRVESNDRFDPRRDRDNDRDRNRDNDRFRDGERDRDHDRFRHGYRPSAEEVGRTQQDRQRTVTTIVERFQGRAPQSPPPSGSAYRERRIFDTGETLRRPQFYDGNRRVIRYSSMQEIPPVIVASRQLNRVQVVPQAQSNYAIRPPAPEQGRYQNDIPASYTSGDAQAVSYTVDPDSAISTDAILFRQGSTDFADAYSYDIVIDMAEAMNAPALSKDTFVIEGHASAEGDYAQNLQLSQERAERISRELVNHGVSAERLMPVGYGEAEATYPEDAAESDRSLDRRVVVFRMK